MKEGRERKGIEAEGGPAWDDEDYGDRRGGDGMLRGAKTKVALVHISALEWTSPPPHGLQSNTAARKVVAPDLRALLNVCVYLWNELVNTALVRGVLG